jgi:hypothetical protein
MTRITTPDNVRKNNRVVQKLQFLNNFRHVRQAGPRLSA